MTVGIDNYFKSVFVDGYDFPESPNCNFRFNSKGFMILNRGIHTIEYSFDGVNTHGDLNPNDSTVGMSFDNRCQCAIWFRGTSGLGTVRVEAWRE